MPETFGQALNRWRTMRKISLRALARGVPCSHGHLWDIEQGSRQVTPLLAAKLDAVLDAGGALIALANATRTRAPAGVAGRLAGGGPPARGREPATAVAHDWLLADPAPLRAARDGGRVGATMVDALALVVTELRRRDDEEGGGDLVELVEPEVRFVARLLDRGSYGEEVGRALHLRLAELAELAGWAAYDAGASPKSVPGWFEAALEAAQAASDKVFGAYVLAMWAFAETDLGRPADAVAILHDAATGVRGLASPRVHAVLGTWEARAAAREGRDARRQVSHAVARAGRQYERRAGGDPDWAYWMIQPELTAEAGRAFALVGDWRIAVSFLEQGLAALGDEYPRDRVLYLSYLAEAYLAGDEVDRARSCAARALALAPQLRSARVAGHVDDVTRRLAAVA
jgi:transcriptional regulator with XRE-family HTH domain/tetratricopeptide (TPR) repeat protein